jgi:hypothetical protein
MALTWYNLNDSRGGEESYQPDGTTVTERTRQWRVDNDGSQTIDDVTIMADAAAPKIGTAHPNHASCKCIHRQCQIESHQQKRQWIFTARYSTKYDIEENPLNDPAKTEWSTETFQTPVWETIDGKGIVNSAGDPFDPPAEKDDSRWTSVTRKNVATSVPDWIFSYQDAVNSDSYTIDSVNVTAGWAKVSAIHLSEVQERNDIEYRVLTVTIHYRGEGEGVGSGSGSLGSYGSGSGSDEIEPWHLNLLDQGMREIPAADDAGGTDGRRNILNEKDGLPVSSPVPLDGEGHHIVEPTLDNSVWLQFQVYREKAFSLIESMFS